MNGAVNHEVSTIPWVGRFAEFVALLIDGDEWRGGNFFE
jgi:hypothetical protein